MPRTNLPDWNHLAKLGDDELPLLDTALLIARDEYPDLDPGGYTAMVDDYAGILRPQLDRDLDLPARLTAVAREAGDGPVALEVVEVEVLTFVSVDKGWAGLVGRLARLV